MKLFEGYLDGSLYQELEWNSQEYKNVIPFLSNFSSYFMGKITDVLKGSGFSKHDPIKDVPLTYQFFRRSKEGNRVVYTTGNMNFLSLRLDSSNTCWGSVPKLYWVYLELDDDDYYWVHLFWQTMRDGTQK